MMDDDGNPIPTPPELCPSCFHQRKHHSVFGGDTGYYCMTPACKCENETANYPNGLCGNCSMTIDDHQTRDGHLICRS